MKKVIYLFFILVILVTTAYANCDEIESDAYVVYTITGGEIDEYDFGREMVLNAKTSEEYRFIGYFLPAGVYRVTNLDSQYPVQVTVYINEIVKPDVIINSNAALMSLVVPYIFDGIRIINISHSLRYNEADTGATGDNSVASINVNANFIQLAS